LFYLENGLPHNRIVFTFARKFGNAVERNRARRLGREAYRLMKGGFKAGYDLALLVYPAKAGTAKQAAKPDEAKPIKTREKLADRQNQLTILFKKAGLLC
jgi:ribonuclease P protein component